MLPEIAAEVLLFLNRRDLDKACGVSKWLDLTIVNSCDVYPLRPVARVELSPPCDIMDATVIVAELPFVDMGYEFSSMDEAVSFAASIIRHSYVESLQVRTPMRMHRKSGSR